MSRNMILLLLALLAGCTTMHAKLPDGTVLHCVTVLNGSCTLDPCPAAAPVTRCPTASADLPSNGWETLGAIATGLFAWVKW